jgi:uroporphyrinogen decarboxylase
MALKNDLILRAAKGEKVERTPVWVMRQAGRVFPEYRAVREKAKDFVEFVKRPDLAAEVTLQPIDILGVDAAIIFSDILVIPEAMGLPYEMYEKKGPVFPKTIKSAIDLKSLKIADAESDLGYVLEAIKLSKIAIANRVPLIGFAGAPFTIFTYMVEGSGSKTFSIAKKMLYTDAQTSHQLLKMITESTILYLKAQIRAGADIVQVFDSWAGVLSPSQYREFAIPYIKAICDAISEVPVIVFAKGAFFARRDLAALNCEVIGLDWTMEGGESREIIGHNKTLQGNLDPCALYGSFADIKRETEQMLAGFGRERYIANLGHGLYPDLSADKVKCFVETVQNYKH